ncbi:hypothetical protein GE09DRAFT_1176609 [Coniochaeta sp. 2T2.1]|nr:hypothetical protein GE09DRAFT_1176609 [Coniochaeta sp. 2T2.1]
MAVEQNRKRRADEALQSYPPAKRQHADDKSSIKSSSYSNFFPSPAFWDNLSKVPLTRWALRELDRRNNIDPPKAAVPAVYTTDLARFARHGGPDLRHLRGCPEPNVSHVMASNRSSASGSRRTGSTPSTKATSLSAKTGKSSSYGPQFETHLVDHGVYMNNRKSKPNNREEDYTQLAQERPSLSPSQFTEGDFDDFQQRDEEVVFENDVMTTVIPVICGNTDIPNKQNVLFTELAPVTSTYDDVVRPKPDFFDGARLGDIDERVRNPEGHMYPLIIPTKHATVPVAPNFFLEAKAPKGAADVLKRQACYDGAYGARVMNALQNYGEEEPGFDGNAYTYSSTYHAGTLKLYAHHVTPPIAPGARPEYHMTQVKAFAMTSDRDTFVQGATAFRNARGLAQRHRDSFIQTANTRARQPRPETPPEAGITVAETQQYEESCDEFVDCEDYVGPQAVGSENYAASQAVDEGPAPIQYLYADDEQPSQESTSAGAEPTMSFATSFTSSFSAQSQTSSKRIRASHSPPSNAQPAKKHDSAKRQTRQTVIDWRLGLGDDH